jgi:small subunit ribosomal protein S16
VAVKIKLKRLGRTRVPTYRIVVADARTKRDGRAIEEIGKYHPKEEPSFIEVNSERAQHWLSVGAQPTAPVMVILKITGDWQKFKGEPGAEGTLRTKAPAADKKETFAVALQAAAKDETATATPKGGSRARRSDTTKADTAKTDAKPDGAKAGAKSDSAKAGAKTADTAKAEVKPESGRSKSKASAEAPAAGSADDSAAAAATSGEATAAAGAAEASAAEAGAAEAGAAEASAAEASAAEASAAEASAAEASAAEASAAEASAAEAEPAGTEAAEVKAAEVSEPGSGA